jgi:hypothetical protein
MGGMADIIAGTRWGASAPAPAQNSAPVTDLSQHVTGGPATAGATNTGATVSDRVVLYWAAGYVLGAIALLWLLGAVVFSTARG